MIIDADVLRGMLEISNCIFEVEKELFPLFLELAHDNLIKMECSIKEFDDNWWWTASYSFKNASDAIGAFDLSKILEHAQKHSEYNSEQKIEILNRIKKEFCLVQNFINDSSMSVKNGLQLLAQDGVCNPVLTFSSKFNQNSN